MKMKGISATELSKATGLSNKSFSAWKKGTQKPSTDAVIKIAAYFNVTADWLLTGKDPSGKESTLTTELTTEQALRVLGVKNKSNAKLIAQMIEYAKEND